MTRPKELMERARAGDVRAIAGLLNRSFRQDEIQAKVERRDNTLIVLLQGAPLSQDAVKAKSIQRVRQGMQRLRPARVETVVVYGQPPEAIAPLWSEAIALVAPTVPPVSRPVQNFTTKPLTADTLEKRLKSPPSPRASRPSARSSSIKSAVKSAPNSGSRGRSSDKLRPMRFVICAIACWVGLPLFWAVTFNAITSGATLLYPIPIILYLFVLTPWSFQESVGLITRYQIRPGYLGALGINTLGLLLAMLLCFPLWSLMPLELLGILVQSIVYGFWVIDINRAGIGPIRGLGVALLMNILVVVPTWISRLVLLGA